MSMAISTTAGRLILLLVVSTAVSAQEWRFYGGDAGGTRYSPLKQINSQNVKNLQRAWTYHMGELDRGGNATDRHHIAPFESTPLVIDGLLYVSTPSNRVIALDAESGQEIWQFYPRAEYSVTSPPAVYQDLVITGAAVPEYPSKGPSGLVRAFDVRSGKLVWTFHTIPQPGETGHDSWEQDAWKDRTGANVWSLMSVDAERGLIFLPVGSASYDFYGADRKGMDLFANCLVALEAASGKLVWYYQMVHHDIWDYDMPAQPVLITVRRDGREIPAIAQVTKMGFVFILDRLTGKPLFPVEERPVPKSDVPGEAAW